MKPHVKLFIIIADELAIIMFTLSILVLTEIVDIVTALSFGTVITAIIVAVTIVAMKPQLTKPKIGPEALIGKEGEVKEVKSKSEVIVLVNGEYWLAETQNSVVEGDKVVITDVEGLKLKIKKINRKKQ
ncbi:MAG: hypothetical protein DRO23_01505 [Thermoprotei archaeon]|nr:MAG: hypothetical protein DRO23_01505 [Thermoprotei archaeon]